MMESRLLRALRGEPADAVPVWFMRQAGRYLPEYRKLRESYGILEMIDHPEIAATVTLQPLERFPVDAAIIFADILPPLRGMGFHLRFTEGEGPRIDNPIRAAIDVDMLAVPPAEETLSSTIDAIRMVKRELASRTGARPPTPLIGFAGAPFTLASYAIEGGSSRTYAATKSFMYREPAAWTRLMKKLVTVQANYLRAQVSAGADALQIFDSWAGIALGPDDYERFVAPYNRMLVDAVKAGAVRGGAAPGDRDGRTASQIAGSVGPAAVPVIHFSTGTGSYLESVAESGCEAYSVDWRISLREAFERIGPGKTLQGNLDPALLLSPWRLIEPRAAELLRAAEEHPGYIFNLGHGILPDTPVDAIARLVDFVHEYRVAGSARGRRRSDVAAGARGAATPEGSARHPIGVLVMAYGGPRSLDDLPGYLADIRSGRPTTPEVLNEMRDHYARIGGRSPLFDITSRQCDALARRLGRDRFRVYLGMRHWAPWIDEVAATMVDDGITRTIGLVMAPHFSSMSVERYRRKVEEGLAMRGARMEFRLIEEYHDNPGLIAALASRVRAGLDRFDPIERSEVHVVFSAHSLPERILAAGDPYETQLKETARLTAKAAALPDDRWSWSYQSAGKSTEPWLGPQLEEHIPALAARGIRKIVSVPVGFVADHVEILFDIDIEAQHAARGCGVTLVRPPALNDDPGFMDALASLVRERAKDWLDGESVDARDEPAGI